MEGNWRRSSWKTEFPLSPVQKYLRNSPRYKPLSQRRSQGPHMSYRNMFVNGERVKVYNWTNTLNLINPEQKIEFVGRKKRLMLVTSKRLGSQGDLSSVPSSPTTPGYRSRLGLPSSPFDSKRSFSYQDLYSPRSPSTPRKMFSQRRTSSTSDIVSLPSERNIYLPRYTPSSRKWTSSFDITRSEMYSSLDSMYGYQRSGSHEGLFPTYHSYFELRPFSPDRGRFDFRSRTGSGTFQKSLKPRSEYRPTTRSECDYPIRYRSSPHDASSRSESGFSVTLSDLDNSFTAGDDETASLSSVDRSLDSLGVFPLSEYDLEQCETDSVLSYDRGLDVVYEDENTDLDEQESSKHPSKPSSSKSLLNRFEQAQLDSKSRHQRPFILVEDYSDSSQRLSESDDVFRANTETVYISDGANQVLETELSTNDSSNLTESSHIGEHNDIVFTQDVKTQYELDGANVSCQENIISVGAKNEEHDDKKQRLSKTAEYRIEGQNGRSDVSLKDINDNTECQIQKVGGSDIEDRERDDVRSHTETVDIAEYAVGGTTYNSDSETDGSSEETLGTDDEEISEHRQIVYQAHRGLKQSNISDIPYHVLEESDENDTSNIHSNTAAAKSGDNMQTENATEFHSNLDSESLELSGFEVVEMSDPVLSSSLLEDDENRSEISDDVKQFSDSSKFLRNISMEYEKIDHELMTEFIDEREATTSSQVHLVEEDSDSDDNQGQRSSDVDQDQSSDEDEHSHRSLNQSDLHIFPEVRFDENENSSTDEKFTVDLAFERYEKVTPGFEDYSDTFDNIKTEHSVDNDRESYERTCDMVKDDKAGGRESGEENEILTDSVNTLYQVTDSLHDENKLQEGYEITDKVNYVPQTVKTETQSQRVKTNTYTGSWIDGESSCKSNEGDFSLTGKTVEGRPVAEYFQVGFEDKSNDGNNWMSGMADQKELSSVSTLADAKLTAADVKLTEADVSVVSSKKDGERLEEFLRKDSSVQVKIEKIQEENYTADQSENNKHITEWNEAKTQLARTPITQEEALEHGGFEHHSGDTLNSLPDWIEGREIDVDSPNSQDLLHRERVVFASRSDELEPFSELSGSYRDAESGDKENVNKEGKTHDTNATEKNIHSEDLGMFSRETDILQKRESSEKNIVRRSEDTNEENSDSELVGTVIQPGMTITDNTSKTVPRLLVTCVLENYTEDLKLDLSDLDPSERITVFENVDDVNYNAESMNLPLKRGLERTEESQNISECVDSERQSPHHLRNRFDSNVSEGPGCALDMERESIHSIEIGIEAGASSTASVEPKSDLHNRIEITVSDDMEEIRDTGDQTVYVDRTEKTLPCVKKATIKTKVRYKVKKTTKTVTKTNMDVKKVCKDVSGSTVEHEHLTKVEQLTVVRQKAWSSNESLITEQLPEENVNVEYKASVDTTKSKDGRQLPSAHYETEYEGVVQGDIPKIKLHKETEDILLTCSSDGEASYFETPQKSVTTDESILKFVENRSNIDLVQAESECDRTSCFDLKDTASKTRSVKETSSQHVHRGDINVAETVMHSGDDKHITSDMPVSNNNEADATSGLATYDFNITGEESRGAYMGASAKFTSSDSGSVDRREEYTRTTSPQTITRKTCRTESRLTDNKLICTLFEETVDVTEDPGDKALYILKDNIHFPKAVDRYEEHILPSAKMSFKFQGHVAVQKPIWTYDLASLKLIDDVTESRQKELQEDVNREIDTEDKKVNDDSRINVQLNNENDDRQSLSVSDKEVSTPEVSELIDTKAVNESEIPVNDSLSGNGDAVMSRNVSVTDTTVRSLHSIIDSKQEQTPADDVWSMGRSHDTVDVVMDAEKHWTDWEEDLHLGIDESNTGDLFLGGGLTESRQLNRTDFVENVAENVTFFQSDHIKDAELEVSEKTADNVTESTDVVINKNDTPASEYRFSDEREKDTVADGLFSVDDNANLLQDKQRHAVAVKRGNDECIVQSDSSEIPGKYTGIELPADTISPLDPEICQEDRDKWKDLLAGNEICEGRVTFEGSVDCKGTGVEQTAPELTRAEEKNGDGLLRESTFVSSGTSHVPVNDHPGQVRVFERSGDIEGEPCSYDHSSGVRVSEDKLSHSGDRLDIQSANKDITLSEVRDVADAGPGHANTSTETLQHQLLSTIQEKYAGLYGPEAAFIETGDSIDSKQAELSPLHTAVNSTIPSDGSTHLGQQEVGKLNAETIQQSAVCSESIALNDGILITTSADQPAKDQKYANVSGTVGSNEFSTNEDTGVVLEVETRGDSRCKQQRTVTVVGELSDSAVFCTQLDDSSDYDRESKIEQFAQAFRQYSIEELPLIQNRAEEQTTVELRARHTSVNQEESDQSNKMSNFDYDDWLRNEPAQQQISMNKAANDGLKFYEENSVSSDSSFVRMDDVSSSDEINRSMGSDQLDRLDWLESQMQFVSDNGWEKTRTTRRVLVTGQVDYDSDNEENNNFKHDLSTSWAGDSEHSDMDMSDTSETRYSTKATGELKEKQTYRTFPAKTESHIKFPVTEHAYGQLRPSRHEMSTSSDGYFSPNEQTTGEFLQGRSNLTVRHISTTSSEGYQSFVTGELSPNFLDDSSQKLSPLSSENKDLEMIEKDLNDTIHEFEALSEQLSSDIKHLDDQSMSSSSLDSSTSDLRDDATRSHFVPRSDQGKTQMHSEMDNIIHQTTENISVRRPYKTDFERKFGNLNLSPQYSSADHMTDHVTVDTISSYSVQSKGELSAMVPQNDTVSRKYEKTIKADDMATSTFIAPKYNLKSNKLLQGQKLVHQDDDEYKVQEFKQGVKTEPLSQEHSIADLKTTAFTAKNTTKRQQYVEQGPSTEFVSRTSQGRPTSLFDKTSFQVTSSISGKTISSSAQKSETRTHERETYENVPDSISANVQDELLRKSHKYLSSSVSVNLSRKWKMFEKLWHSFDDSSWQGSLSPHLFTFVFQKSADKPTSQGMEFEKLYPLLLLEDVERCQNHTCPSLYSDTYLKQRKMQRYFLRGFTRDPQSLWNTHRKQSLAPLCDIPEERLVSFSDSASISLPSCHVTSIHPSMVSYTPVSKLQYNRFKQGSDESADKLKSEFLKEDNSNHILQYICQGDVSDPTIMLSKRLKALNAGEEESEMLDDALLRGLRHYRKKVIQFHPYNTVRRLSNGRRQLSPLNNEVIYEEEEDERLAEHK